MNKNSPVYLIVIPVLTAFLSGSIQTIMTINSLKTEMSYTKTAIQDIKYTVNEHTKELAYLSGKGN